MKHIKFGVLAWLVACAMSMASYAAVPCKSGQKTAQKGSQLCAPVSASKAKAKAKTKAASKTKVISKAKLRSKSKASVSSRSKSKSRTKARITAAASGVAATDNTDASPELPASLAPTDCDSAQTFLQGGSAQCQTVTFGGLTMPARANPGTPCFAALGGSQSALRLAPKVPFLSASAASPEVLENRSLPTKSERKALSSLAAGYSMCLDMAASWRQEAYAPAVVTVLDAYWLEAQAILHQLASGKRSYGDAARAIAATEKATRNQLDGMERRLQSGANTPPFKPDF